MKTTSVSKDYTLCDCTYKKFWKRPQIIKQKTDLWMPEQESTGNSLICFSFQYPGWSSKSVHLQKIVESYTK
jgi:hypothetical protein